MSDPIAHLDFSGDVPQFVDITSVTGRKYHVELWVPMEAVLAYQADMKELLGASTPGELVKDTSRLIKAIEFAHKIFVVLMGKSYPDFTADDAATEFPNERSLVAAGFLLAESTAARSMNSQSSRAAMDSARTRMQNALTPSRPARRESKKNSRGSKQSTSSSPARTGPTR